MDRSLFSKLLNWSQLLGRENNPRTGRMEVYGCECPRRRHSSDTWLTPSCGSVVYRMGLDTPVVHAVNDECFIWISRFQSWKHTFRCKSNTTTLRLGSKVARLKLKGISCRVDRRWNIAVESKQRETPHHFLNAKQPIVRFFLFLKKTFSEIKTRLFIEMDSNTYLYSSFLPRTLFKK